ncbi:unnamed protein product, partial [Effrenium voratum]
SWYWGPASRLQEINAAQDFLVSLVRLGERSVALAFRDANRRPTLHTLLLGPGRAVSACAQVLPEGPISELQLLQSAQGFWLLYATDQGVWVRFAWGTGPWNLNLQVEPGSLLATASRVAGVDVPMETGTYAVLAFHLAASTSGFSCTVQRVRGQAPVLGRSNLLNGGPMQHLSLASLSNGRAGVSFVDARSAGSSVFRLGRIGGWDESNVSEMDWQELDWGELLGFDFGPGSLSALGSDLLLASATQAQLLHLWGRHLAKGEQLPLLGSFSFAPIIALLEDKSEAFFRTAAKGWLRSDW